MSNDIEVFKNIPLMARALATSKVYNFCTEGDWMALMFVAHSEGRHPASVARDYHIINGRPSLRSEVILARFQQAGGSVKWIETSDTSVTGVFSHPQGGEMTVTWNMARAAQAELKSQMWRKFPQQMLRARAVSEAVRAIYPVVLAGFYDEHEVHEMPPIADNVKEAPVQKKLPKPLQAIEDDDHFNDLIEEFMIKAVDVSKLSEGYKYIVNNYDLTDGQAEYLKDKGKELKSKLPEGKA